MQLLPLAPLLQAIEKTTATGCRCGLLLRSPTEAPAAYTLRRLPDDPEAYARGLYAALRQLDQAGNDLILVEAVPDEPRWAAVADRLRRAACGAGVDQTPSDD